MYLLHYVPPLCTSAMHSLHHIPPSLCTSAMCLRDVHPSRHTWCTLYLLHHPVCNVHVLLVQAHIFTSTAILPPPVCTQLHYLPPQYVPPSLLNLSYTNLPKTLFPMHVNTTACCTAHVHHPTWHPCDTKRGEKKGI